MATWLYYHAGTPCACARSKYPTVRNCCKIVQNELHECERPAQGCRDNVGVLTRGSQSGICGACCRCVGSLGMEREGL
ncbi:hypothetical protein HaLaN_22021 [Haematococcus lacustris]|uniref:Uncharacterized protein n=1 Tax=Haematococcus lacustris TaxID=44745 RepID=A0A699ZPS7_HAELA|nr:hypothetical protein HaLaN_22021 [Haematococcus lacustris]